MEKTTNRQWKFIRKDLVQNIRATGDNTLINQIN
jgi:hypothetical protein